MARWNEQLEQERSEAEFEPERPFAPGRRTRTMSLVRLQRSPDGTAPPAPASTGPSVAPATALR